jgi:hypothetical protein
MTLSLPYGPIFTNINVYLSIAEGALAESTRLLEANRTPKPDGQPGYILSSDPERKSFKQSCIAIAFAGMYLGALLSIIGRARLGKDLYKKIERITTYEEKLRLLGVCEQHVLASCKRFRKTRNDLMHESAIDFEKLAAGEIRTAQEEAVFGVEFVKSIGSKLLPAP